MRHLNIVYRQSDIVARNDGVVFNRKTGHVYNHKDSKGYVLISLGKNKPTVKKCRVVAECYKWLIPLTQEYEVHHVNKIKDDDTPNNLQVLTHKEHSDIHKNWVYQQKKVIMDDTVVFDSIGDAEEYLGFTRGRSHIKDCIIGRNRHHKCKGHTFKFFDS